MNGSWKGSKCVGNFLATKGSGFDTTIPSSLVTFLNILVIIGLAANVAAGVAGEIRRGFEPDSAGGGGFKLSQVW